MRTLGSFDVAIVGAGTAGAAAAGFCAERGMRVLCVDRRPLDDAGARWVNGVPEHAFTSAGLPLPHGDEHRGEGGGFHLVAGRGPERLVLGATGVLEVDMRHLVARLHERAVRLGATLLGDTRVLAASSDILATDRGDARVRWLVDASGHAGARLLDLPPVPPEHLCTAAQEVRRVRDPAGARAFFAAHEIPMGDVLCFTGIAGGFSILNVRVTGDHVGILTGSIPALGHPSGKAILDTFVAEQPWIGERIFGGARAIPLRRPRDVLARGIIALLGDAGCQVFPAHGSGIGAGLVAARVLADALAAGQGVHGYAVAWQRRHGGLLAAYDLFRRFSQTLTPDDIARMIASGLMDADAARAGMVQAMPRLSLRALPRKLGALARSPALAKRLGRVIASMLAVRVLYARYPRDPAELPHWSRTVARVCGDSPDVP